MMTDLLTLVESLETGLTSPQSSIQRESLKKFTDDLGTISLSSIRDEELDHVIDFFIARLILPDPDIICTLLDGFIWFAQSKRPTGTPLLTPAQASRICHAGLFRQLSISSLNKPGRLRSFQLLRLLLHDQLHLTELGKLASDFVLGYVQAVDGEKDPENLLIIFDMNLIVMENFPLDNVQEDFFEIMAAYFPIKFSPPPFGSGSNVSRTDLINGLHRCLLTSRTFAGHSLLQLLCEKADADWSSDGCRDAVRLLADCLNGQFRSDTSSASPQLRGESIALRHVSAYLVLIGPILAKLTVDQKPKMRSAGLACVSGLVHCYLSQTSDLRELREFVLVFCRDLGIPLDRSNTVTFDTAPETPRVYIIQCLLEALKQAGRNTSFCCLFLEYLIGYFGAPLVCEPRNMSASDNLVEYDQILNQLKQLVIWQSSMELLDQFIGATDGCDFPVLQHFKHPNSPSVNSLDAFYRNISFIVEKITIAITHQLKSSDKHLSSSKHEYSLQDCDIFRLIITIIGISFRLGLKQLRSVNSEQQQRKEKELEQNNIALENESLSNDLLSLTVSATDKLIRLCFCSELHVNLSESNNFQAIRSELLRKHLSYVSSLADCDFIDCVLEQFGATLFDQLKTLFNRFKTFECIGGDTAIESDTQFILQSLQILTCHRFRFFQPLCHLLSEQILSSSKQHSPNESVIHWTNALCSVLQFVTQNTIKSDNVERTEYLRQHLARGLSSSLWDSFITDLLSSIDILPSLSVNNLREIGLAHLVAVSCLSVEEQLSFFNDYCNRFGETIFLHPISIVIWCAVVSGLKLRVIHKEIGANNLCDRLMSGLKLMLNRLPERGVLESSVKEHLLCVIAQCFASIMNKISDQENNNLIPLFEVFWYGSPDDDWIPDEFTCHLLVWCLRALIDKVTLSSVNRSSSPLLERMLDLLFSEQPDSRIERVRICCLTASIQDLSTPVPEGAVGSKWTHWNTNSTLPVNVYTVVAKPLIQLINSSIIADPVRINKSDIPLQEVYLRAYLQLASNLPKLDLLDNAQHIVHYSIMAVTKSELAETQSIGLQLLCTLSHLVPISDDREGDVKQQFTFPVQCADDLLTALPRLVIPTTYDSCQARHNNQSSATKVRLAVARCLNRLVDLPTEIVSRHRDREVLPLLDQLVDDDNRSVRIEAVHSRNVWLVKT